MNSLIQYINESLTNKQSELIEDMFLNMFNDTKLTKDNILSILKNLSKDVIVSISKTYSKNDVSNYLAYEVNEDLFINFEDNKNKILSQISEYISKYRL